MKTFLALCGVLLLAGGARGQDMTYSDRLLRECSSSAAVSSQTTTCQTALLTAMGAASLATAFQDVNNLCSNIEPIATYNGCVRNAWKGCLSTELLGLVPTENIARDSSQYFCDHRNEINLNCAIAGDPQCVSRAVSNYGSATSPADLVKESCSLLDAMGSCFYSGGKDCSGHSVSAFSTYWMKSYPPACGATALHVPTHFLLLGACAVLLSKMAALF